MRISFTQIDQVPKRNHWRWTLISYKMYKYNGYYTMQICYNMLQCTGLAGQNLDVENCFNIDASHDSTPASQPLLIH